MARLAARWDAELERIVEGLAAAEEAAAAEADADAAAAEAVSYTHLTLPPKA